MSSGREQAVQLINEAKLAASGNEKVQALRSLREIIVKREPALLLEFLPDVVEFQVEPAAAVRKYLAELLADAAAAAPRPPVLAAAAACLGALAADAAAAVAKAAIAAAVAVFRSAFSITAHQGGRSPGLELTALWGAADGMRAAVVGLLGDGTNGSPAAPDGVRLQAVRFSEQAVLLYTAAAKPPPPPGAASLAGPPGPLPADHALLRPAQLLADSAAAAAAIANLLRAPGVGRLLGPLRIVAVKAAGALAARRPRLLGRLLPPLLALAKATASQEGSVAAASTGRAVADALAGVAAAEAAEAAAWRPKLAEALAALGTAGDADAAAAAERLLRPRGALLRRPAGEGQGAAKRAKLEAPPVANGHAAHAVPLQHAPPLQQPHPQLAHPPPPAAQGAPPPGELAQAQFVIGVLLGKRDPQLLDAYLQTLDPGLLADVVIANMARLPPTAPDDGGGGSSAGGLTGLMQGLPQRQPQKQQQPPHSSPYEQQRQPPQHQQPPPPGLGAAQQGGGPQPATHIKAEGPPAARTPPTPQFALRPADMSADDRATLRQAAVQRVLSSSGAGLEAVRDAILAHLVSQGPEDDAAAAAMVAHLLADFDRPGAHDCTLAWLHALFAARPQQGMAARADNAAAAGAQAAAPPAGGPSAGGPPAAGGTGSADSAAAVRDAAAQQGGSISAPPDSAAPSAYESVLLALLEGLRSGRGAKDPALMRLLLEAPWLPAPAVPSFLAATLPLGPDWATAALSTANNLVLLRPPDRDAALGVILDAAVAEDAGVHSKAIRLLANRLFPQPIATAQVEAFARRQLDMLLSSAAQRAADAAEDADEAAAPAGEQGAAADPAAAAGPPAGDSTAGDGGGGGSHSGGGPGQAEVAVAARRCGLYCALCTKRHSLLPRLLEVFAGASPAGQAAILRNATGLARTIGAQAPQLLALVAESPTGSDRLLLHMLHVLTESAPPPQPLVAAALRRYDASSDVRWAVPALAGAPRERASQLLPAAAATCAAGDTATFDAAVKRLLMARPAAGGAPQMTPAQLLMGLHSIQPSPSGVPLRALMAALSACLANREAFPPEAAASALGQLVGRAPLPPLFMRFVMQAGAAWPKLKPFVLELLTTLVGKQVWNNSAQWKGWLLAAEQAGPPAYPALLSLPPSVLAKALTAMRQGAALRPKLAAFAAAPDCRVGVSLDTLRVLQGEAD